MTVKTKSSEVVAWFMMRCTTSMPENTKVSDAT